MASIAMRTAAAAAEGPQKSVVVGRCTVYTNGNPNGHKSGATVSLPAADADNLIAKGLATLAGAPPPPAPAAEHVTTGDGKPAVVTRTGAETSPPAKAATLEGQGTAPGAEGDKPAQSAAGLVAGTKPPAPGGAAIHAPT